MITTSLRKTTAVHAPPPLKWTELDIAVVALEMSREFRNHSPAKIACAIGLAAGAVKADQGRPRFARRARQLLRGTAPRRSVPRPSVPR